MEKLYSSQKAYVNTKRFTLKSLSTISLIIALFAIPELKAQNLIVSNTGFNSEMIAPLQNSYVKLNQAASLYFPNSGIIEGNLCINLFK